jgi:DNA gyrase subunit A
MGRGTHGVRGIRLEAGDVVIGMVQLEEGKQVLTVSANGYGKRTPIGEYRVTNRGGKGIRNMMLTEKTGDAVGVAAVSPEDEVMVTTVNGTVIRTAVGEISTYGRASQGVRVIRLRDGDVVRDIVAGKNERELEKESAAVADAGDSGAVDEESPAEPAPAGEPAEEGFDEPAEARGESEGDEE